MENRFRMASVQTTFGESHSPFVDTLIDHLPGEIFWKDLDGFYQGGNQAFLKRAGAESLADIVGKTDAEIFPHTHFADFYRQYDDEIRSERRREYKTFSSQPFFNDDISWYEITKLAMTDTMGKVIGILGIYFDATERVQREKQLHRQRNLLDSVIENLPVGLFVKDAKDQYRYQIWNAKMEEIFGTAASQMLGKSDIELFGQQEGEFRRSSDLQVADGNYILEFYEDVKTEDKTINIHLIKFPLYDLDGKPEIVVGFVDDVTDWLTMQKQLKQHRDHLQILVDERTADLLEAVNAVKEASQAKSQFLANMSHELRTPMHAIINYAQMGNEKLAAASTDKLPKYFSNIEKSGRRLVSLVNDLLDLSKMEAGKMQFHFSEVNVRDCADQAIDELRSLLEEKNITVALEGGANNTVFYCDSTRLVQVFINLLSNAIKFSGQDKRITLRFEDTLMDIEGEDMPALDIRVIDQGPGIPDEELETIFSTFTQSSRTSTGAGGTGLGLTICRQIMAAHQGSIHAENHPKGGTSFVLRFPLLPSSTYITTKE